MKHSFLTKPIPMQEPHRIGFFEILSIYNTIIF